MRFWIVLLSFVFFSGFFSSLSLATTFNVTNSTGDIKDIFYTNESIYVFGTNITNMSKPFRIYIINDTSNITNGVVLQDFRGISTTISTNNTGDLPATLLWAYPNEGKFDVVLSENETYENTSDTVDSLSATGFEVKVPLFPFVKISLGSNSSSSYTWLPSDNGKIVPMMQFALQPGNNENVQITGFGLTATGTGNDKIDIDEIDLIEDSNRNGIYEPSENLATYGVYNKNDGSTVLTLLSPYTISPDSNLTFLVIYKIFSNNSLYASNSTYQFILSNVYGKGVDSGKTAIINGTPLTSALLTMSPLLGNNPTQPINTTPSTTTTVYITTPLTTSVTSTKTITSTTTVSVLFPANFNYTTIILVAIAIIIPVVLIIYFMKRNTQPPWSASTI